MIVTVIKYLEKGSVRKKRFCLAHNSRQQPILVGKSLWQKPKPVISVKSRELTYG